MPSKSSKSSNKRRDNLGLGTPHNKIQEREAPTHRKKDKENMDSISEISPSRKQIRTPERQRNIPGSGATSIRALGITLFNVHSKQSLVAEVKASKSDVDSDSEPEPEREGWNIDAKPSSTIATTKL
jgi:hypothetical protein